MPARSLRAAVDVQARIGKQCGDRGLLAGAEFDDQMAARRSRRGASAAMAR